MKQFLRHRTAGEIIAQCIEQGVFFNAERYDKGGDHLVVYLPGPDDTPITVLYNTVSGHFFGDCGDLHFSSENVNLDSLPWFDVMLDFFYVPKE